jgi:hypothetical protein
MPLLHQSVPLPASHSPVLGLLRLVVHDVRGPRGPERQARRAGSRAGSQQEDQAMMMDATPYAQQMKSVCPFTTKEMVGVVMTNFDHSIDHDIATALKAKESFAQYPGGNFHGLVWWSRDNHMWRCEVSVHHEAREVIEAGTLEEIMDEVCRKWGNE